MLNNHKNTDFKKKFALKSKKNRSYRNQKPTFLLNQPKLNRKKTVMQFKNSLFIFIFLLLGINSFAQEHSKKSYSAQAISGEMPRIDGLLDDADWENAHWQGDFIQHEPEEGKNAFQSTSFAVLYDNNFLYVAVKAFDAHPDSIVKRMTRRDNIDGDFVGFQIDSYGDKRTAFSFIVSASGVKNDFIASNDGEQEDLTWDAIWWVKTSVNAEGWVAEFKIPFTQLRFGKAQEQVWGFQIGRSIFRKGEMLLWQPISRNASGWVSHFGTLNGLKISPQKPFDITPYTTASMETFEKEEGNPYADGFDTDLNAGIDGKIGLSNNFTLDFSINPDFGQVEADPSEVNLSAYESFFNEQRPFFIEGRNILSYPLMFGDGDLAAESLFYSRRIGRRPHYSPEIEDNEYLKMPQFTSILGAAKITGKTPNGWSIGILESVTAQEKAKIWNENSERTETVEPLTNYLVARVQRDFNKGNTIVGTVLTSVNRDIDTENLNFVPTSAYTGGFDFTQYFKNKEYNFKLTAYWSDVNGSTEAITELQNSPARYFQRPDAEYLDVNENLTSLNGAGGNIQVGKMGGKLKFMLAGAMKSPSLEVNDIGYLQSVDDIMEVFWMGYRFYKPFSIFRSLSINFNQWLGWDFGGTKTYSGGNVNVHSQFKNFWNLSFGTNLNGNSISNGMLRGGNSMILPGNKNFWAWIGTNEQKKFYISSNVSMNKSFEENYNTSKYLNISLTYRPFSTLSLSLTPEYNWKEKELQYVDEVSYNNTDRYIFSSLQQKIASLSLRINYNITPDLSIQYWGQPFIAAGEFSDFKYITNNKSPDYNDRFYTYPTSQISFDQENNEYLIDENLDNSSDYTIYNPDFNFKEFLSNMVLKWEYSAGSTVYLVWSQSRSHYIEEGQFDLQQDMDYLFNEKARNVFLIKFSYRIGLR